MWPKLIQVNKTDVFILGGNNSAPGTDRWGAFEPKARNKMLKLNLQSMTIYKMKNMPNGK
jgi:hypothetical protein